LCARLDLKDPSRFSATKHVVRGGVFGWDVLQAKELAVETALQFERPSNRRQHAQAQAVDFQKPERLDVILVPLNDRAIGHRRVLHWNEAGERMLRDDEATDVL